MLKTSLFLCLLIYTNCLNILFERSLDQLNIKQAKLNQKQIQKNNQYIIQANGCFKITQNNVIKATNFCYINAGGRDALQCIRDQIFILTGGQVWNVMAYLEGTSALPFLAYWKFQNCTVTIYYIQGSLITYFLWPSKAYPLMKNNQLQENSFKRNQNTNGICYPTRVTEVNNSLKICLAQQFNQQSCIKNYLNQKLGQKWNVYTQNDNRDAWSDILYYYADNCSVVYNHYGQPPMNISIWKAQ